jgi:hypothetical protein
MVAPARATLSDRTAAALQRGWQGHGALSTLLLPAAAAFEAITAMRRQLFARGRGIRHIRLLGEEHRSKRAGRMRQAVGDRREQLAKCDQRRCPVGFIGADRHTGEGAVQLLVNDLLGT